MSLWVGSIKIIYSYNYLPMPLAALPKTFGFEEKVKGYFPHLFNQKENWNYIGRYPDAHYYCPDSMKKEQYDAFVKWHEQQDGKVKLLKCLLIINVKGYV